MTLSRIKEYNEELFSVIYYNMLNEDIDLSTGTQGKTIFKSKK